MRPSLTDVDPLPWQADIIAASLTGSLPGDIAAVRGGLGSGKSLALCIIAILIAETRPGACVVLGMDTYRRLRDVHLPIMRALLRGSSVAWEVQSQTYRWPGRDGSTIIMRHLDTAAGSGLGQSPIEGVNAHAVLIDECQTLRPDVLDVARARARVPMGEHRPLVILSGIPVEPAWWVDAVRRVGGAAYLPSSAENAAHLGAGWLDRMRELLTDRDYQALIEGRPLPPVGTVLHAWRPEVCTTSEVVHYASRRTLLAVDFGIRSPAALLLVEVRPHVWCVTREWAPDDETLPALCRRLLADLAPRAVIRAGAGRDKRLPVDMVVADPAGLARSSQTGIGDVEVMSRELGIPVRVEHSPERRDVVAGITRMNLALERGALLVHRDLYDAGLRATDRRRTLARALTGYRWDTRDPSRPAKDGAHDHHIDALRYAVREVLWHESATRRAASDEQGAERPAPAARPKRARHQPGSER